MRTFFIALLQCSITMSFITLLYAAIQSPMAKRYTASGRYLIWLVIAAGWLIPFRPEIELPVLPAQVSDTTLVPAVQVITTASGDNLTSTIATTGKTAAGTGQISVWTVVVILWMTGVIAALVYHVLCHRRFMIIVNRWSERVTEPQTCKLFDTLKQEKGIKTDIELKWCSGISSPMLTGLLHPVILIPPVQLAQEEAALILSHELIHYKRHDLWYKIIILMATVLHWFNPVVYLMAREASSQCEISCDALVLREADAGSRRRYGETILAMVRHSNRQHTTLSTNFYGGSRGMKNRMTAIMDTGHKKAAVIVLCLVFAGMLLTGATLASGKEQLISIPGTAFTEQDYDKLIALQLKNYQNMTVAEYQNRVWTLTDTKEYMALLERFCMDEQLEKMRDTNETASFLFNVLTPLTAENWKTQRFGGSVSTGGSADGVVSDAQLEYELTLTILDANQLTVGKYMEAEKGIQKEITKFLQKYSREELRDEKKMNKAILSKTDSLIKKWSTKTLKTAINYYYIPLEKDSWSEQPSTDSDMEGNQEDTSAQRRIEAYGSDQPGTKEDYQALMKLKTEDYQSQPVADFNTRLLDWANEHNESWDRILMDTVLNEFEVSLSPQERSFVTLSVYRSGAENGEQVKSHYTKKPKKDSGFSKDMQEKTITREGSEPGQTAWCTLYYQATYHIEDENRLTVGERDRCVGGAISEIQKFWDTTEVEQLLTMSQEDVLKKLKSITKQYSNDLIQITIVPEQVAFEKADEYSKGI